MLPNESLKDERWAQHWRLTAENELVNRARIGLALAIPDRNEKPMALVWLSTKKTEGDAREQKWCLNEDGYMEAFKLSGTVLEVKNGSTANGAVVQMGNKSGNAAQRWRMIPVTEDEVTDGTVSKKSRQLSATASAAPSGLSAAEDEREIIPVAARLELLQQLNTALTQVMPYIDLSLVDREWSFAAVASGCRGLVLSALKEPMWDDALKVTESTSSVFELKLSRSRALKFITDHDEPDHQARYMVFCQAMRQMNSMPPERFRVPSTVEKLYTCTFMGERSHDAGGPYRESWSQYAQELESPHLPLLLRTPNGRHATGQNRDRWVLHPGSRSVVHQDMFVFLGKLMGIAVRTRQYMALNVAPLIWDLLVGERVSPDALAGVDQMLRQSMHKIRHIEDEGIGEDMFAYVVMETYTTLSTDDRAVELVPGGAQRDVTFQDRSEYADLVENYRLHEFDVQIVSLRRGLATVLPVQQLCLFTGEELETMVCGRPYIDIDLLESCTEYSSCSADDEHVKFFWRVMREFSHEERSAFLRFTWGRSRLPLNAAGFPQRMKILNFNKNPADQYFPVAHTCFFQCELPQYSTIEIMRDKLRYAIFNCQAIDGDDTGVGMQAAAMGWED